MYLPLCIGKFIVLYVHKCSILLKHAKSGETNDFHTHLFGSFENLPLKAVASLFYKLWGNALWHAHKNETRWDPNAGRHTSHGTLWRPKCLPNGEQTCPKYFVAPCALFVQ